MGSEIQEIHHILIMCQILVKTRQRRFDKSHNFINFKATYGNPLSNCLDSALSEISITTWQFKLMLSISKSSGSIKKHLSKSFESKLGFRQNKPLSVYFFDIILGKII